MEILIAEDDKSVRLFLKKKLVKWGYEVIETCDGKEALEMLQKKDAPKIAILDWLMPAIDGIDVCRKVREIKTKEPVYIIMLTVMDKQDELIKGLRAGANDYVTKPFDSNELQARIEVGCRVVELQRTLAMKIKELQEALDHVKTLQGILPICAHCHKIRTDKESWEMIENYLSKHTDLKLSHSICPECWKTHYPKYYKKNNG